MIDEEIKQIILQNQATLEKINKKLKWQFIGTIFKIIFIIGPIVLGIIWLLPFFQKYFPEVKAAMDTIRLTFTQIQSGALDNANVSVDQICNEEMREQIIQRICR